MCRVDHEKRWAGRSTSWNQDAGRNINNLRYVDDTTVMAETEEELKSLLKKVETMMDFISLHSKIMEDDGCSHKIKRKKENLKT